MCAGEDEFMDMRSLAGCVQSLEQTDIISHPSNAHILEESLSLLEHDEPSLDTFFYSFLLY